MKKAAFAIVAVSLLLASSLASAEEAAEEAAKTTLTGEYHWSQRSNTGDLEAVFTPTGEGSWDVAFNFVFRERAHTYIGKATGSLTEGELKGTVFNESGKREFTFTGSFEDGQFSGTHAEIESGKPVPTGTLKLAG